MGRETEKERKKNRGKLMRLGMVVHVPNLGTGNLKAGELSAHGQPGLCRNFQARLSYISQL